MKSGLTLTEMAAELERRSSAKADFVIDTRELTLLSPRGSAEEEMNAEKKVQRVPELHLPQGVGEYKMTEHAQRQLADRIGIPYKLWSRFRDDHPDLLDHNVNTLFRREPERRLIRCYDWPEDQGGPINRAVMSDRYRRRDYEDMAQIVFPILHDLPDVTFPSCQITEQRMYIKALIPGLQGEVKAGDVVQLGIGLSNSETGSGAFNVWLWTYRLWCSNGCGHENVLRSVHLGRAAETDETYRILTDEALQKDDEAFALKLRDVVRHSVSEVKFEQILAQMREAAGAPPAAEPQQAMERLSKSLDLGEEESKSAFRHLITGSANGPDGKTDFTPYGFANAITRTAADVEDYDRATELEMAGSKVLALAGTREWATLTSVD